MMVKMLAMVPSPRKRHTVAYSSPGSNLPATRPLPSPMMGCSTPNGFIIMCPFPHLSLVVLADLMSPAMQPMEDEPAAGRTASA